MSAKQALHDAHTGISLFNTYLSKHQEVCKDSKINDSYYHVNVVAEAYQQGLNDGKNIGRQDFIDKIMKSSAEKFAEKATQVYILTKNILSALSKNGYTVSSFHINVFHSNPKVIISVDNQQLLDDEFVELAYTKIFEIKSTFNNLFDSTLDMGIMGNENIDLELLSQDGYEYSENI